MDTLSEQLRVRLSPGFKRRIEENAERLQIHPSAFVRQCLAQVVGAPSEEMGDGTLLLATRPLVEEGDQR